RRVSCSAVGNSGVVWWRGHRRLIPWRDSISGILAESKSIPTIYIVNAAQIVDNEFIKASCRSIVEAATVPKDWPMRKWFVPLTVLGVGGIGAFLLTDKGTETLRRWRAEVGEATPPGGGGEGKGQAEV